MTQPQSAICAEGGDFGLFLTLVLADGDTAAVRRVLAALPDMTESVAVQSGEPALTSSVAIGAACWPRLTGRECPDGLVPFAPLADGARKAPATPADLFLHIHSPRHDANLMLARRVAGALGNHVRVVEEVMGFRHLGKRDLTGFVDGTENPEGDDRTEVALVKDDPFAGGSFVSLQRYVHDLPRWEALSLPDQEAAVGRTKDSDEEMEVKPPFAHIARVVIEEDGEELEVLRHSMPYGTTSENGLYFVAYCASPAPFRKMLERMVLSAGDGHHDRLLDFTRPVTGAAFFAPSADWLRALD
ncbi:Dyp-type peroxidase [Paramagnetospirillum magneticum]|uniref:Predicted iron-dependent peroxidase n=1 Tax=Paramagnetospirillum magneticum (strain ATCC 700264 / AMB-1) TaxID=342108 RepID=Q2W9G6_PARM1|nr:Dyp-type peroxidase [Paramagnetospirillum magneticum]BAE49509.1 Predicted iron-dependent peroxidase [Paramagnetospirillum magneticum AMB-1]